MPSRTIETIVEGFIFPEGPRWHDGKLCFVDFHTCGVDCVGGARVSRKRLGFSLGSPTDFKTARIGCSLIPPVQNLPRRAS